MIWLIGNRGMLGAELSGTLSALGIDFVGTDREVSILDEEALGAFAAGKKIDWIVNCAAYTAVDRAEDERDAAEALNVQGPAKIARTAERIGASLLHVSTDYVFDGAGKRPYREDDPVGPTGVYGRTKADGELAALNACGRTVILRTAWLYGRHGPNFVYTMLRLMRERDSLGVVADQRGSPTWALDLSRTICAIVKAKNPVYGVFHFTGGGETTWHGFALEIHALGLRYGLLEKERAIKALTTAEYPTKARRPVYSVLSAAKIREVYGIAVPDWKVSLSAFMQEETLKKE